MCVCVLVLLSLDAWFSFGALLCDSALVIYTECCSAMFSLISNALLGLIV